MKHVFRFLMALALGIALAGCNGRQNKSGQSSAEKHRASKALPRIGVSVPSQDHGWTGGVVWWAEKTREEMTNCKITVTTAKDSAEQVNQIENLLVQGIDALVVLPQEPGPLTRICEQVAKQGVYLVVVDRNIEKEVQNLTVVGDNPGFGRVCAEELVKCLGGKGNIVIMEGMPCQVNTDRVGAFRAVVDKYPDIHVLDSQPADWNTEKALKLMENYLQKHSKIDALWTGDDDLLIGALKAYSESGRKDIRFLVGGAGSKAIVKMVLDKNPLVPFDVTYPPRMIQTGIELAAKHLTGKLDENFPKRLVVPAQAITPANAHEYYYPDSVY
ncbi:MAG: ABC transporter substrate-binding protein [Victivallales bacterium]|nr:ABC transporter substrate-binding protein [Victivallales bacterium]